MEIDPIEQTLRQLVRDAAVRSALRRPLHRVSPEEAEGVLAPLTDYLRAVDEAVRECVRLAYGAGQQAVHRAMHDAPGVDHLMVDEAAEYAGEPKR